MRVSSKMRGSAAHGAGDLHRVDDEPLAGQRLQCARVVAVVHPPIDELHVEGTRRCALLGDDGHRRRRRSADRPRRARAARNPLHRCRASGPTPVRRRGGARPGWRLGAGSAGTPSRPASKVGEGDRRPPLGHRSRVDPEPRPGDHAERSFGADEQLREIGSDGGPGCAAGADEPRRRRGPLRARRPCPRSCRSGSSTDRRLGRRSNRRRSRCPSTGASDRPVNPWSRRCGLVVGSERAGEHLDHQRGGVDRRRCPASR